VTAKKSVAGKRAGKGPSSGKRSVRGKAASSRVSVKKKAVPEKDKIEAKSLAESAGEMEKVLEDMVKHDAFSAMPDEANNETAGELASGVPEVEFITFELLGRHYAVRVSDVEEILRKQRVTYVPRTKDFVLGVTTVRGRIVPIIDLAELIEPGSKVEYPDKGKVLVIRGQDCSAGIQLGRSLNIVVLTEEDIQPHPAHIADEDKKLTEGVIKVENNFISVFETGKLLSVPAAREVHKNEA
jgi:purine-binding chemotaxis protein CheW